MDYGPGKSAVLWRKYFRFLGIEMMEADEICAERWARDIVALNITVHIGDQLLKSQEVAAMKQVPVYDLIVDDGAHTNRALKHSFDKLWPVINPGGYYVMEDMGSPAFSYLDCEPLP